MNFQSLEERVLFAAFTSGDVVVQRMGDGSAALGSTGTAVFVDEFNTGSTSQTPLNTVALPTTQSGSNHRLVASGSASSEGLLSLSQDGRYLALVGYDAAVGTASVKSVAARTIALVNSAGTVDSSTSGTLGGTDNARGVGTKDGTAFWFAHANGVSYVTYGSSPTVASLSSQNSRAVVVSGNQVYVTSGSGTNTNKGVNAVGAGLPTSGAQTLTRLSGETDTTNPNTYQYAFVDRDASVAGNDTLYIADNTNGILKYSFDGTAWTSRGTVAGSFTGLTAGKNGSSADIYVTTAAGDKLQKYTDTSAFNAAISSGSLTTLATAPANEAFRGVAFAPVSGTHSAPAINAQSFSVNENAASATAVGTVVATVDSGLTKTYSITAGNTGGAFQIDAATGAITVNTSSALNFETTSSFALTVQVSDNGATPLNSSATVTVSLNDVNEAPAFGQTTYAATLPENTASGTVATVSATDPDTGATPHVVAYNITAGNTGNAFAIDGSGNVVVNNPTAIDFETHPSYSLTVQASDGSLANSATVNITLTDVNEAPVFSPNTATFSLADHAAHGTVVGTVAAADVDAGDSRSYSITAGNGTGGGAFAVDSGSGQITVADSSQIDHATTPTFVLTVTATDGGGLTSTDAVTVNLAQNHAPAFVGAPYTFGPLAENSASGSAVGTVLATDQDPGQAVAYSIVAGNVGGAFAIDGATGAITVNSSSALDFELTPSFTLTVRATDNAGTPLSANASATITLSNVNEAPTIGAQTFSVAENSSTGTVVGAVVSSDPDVGDSKLFAITGGNGAGAFAIDGAGHLTVADTTKLDFETTASFPLTVSVTDGGGLTAAATVTVSLTNVNEAPAFSGAPYVFSLAENSANGSSVGSATATDPDATDTVGYAITAGNSGGAFAISPTTGAITVADTTKLNFEASPTFALTITATDSHSVSSTASATVNLTNVAEPTTYASASFTIAENSANGTTVGTAPAVPDTGVTIDSYAITAGNSTGAFAISNAGVITVADGTLLDYEAVAGHAFVLTVAATDSTSGVTAGTVTVNLSNVNEAPSMTVNRTVVLNPGQTVQIGSALLGATDPENATLTYTVTGAPTAGSLKKNGSVITSFTSTDLNAADTVGSSIRYTTTGAAGSTDSFTVSVSDGTNVLTGITVNVNVVAVTTPAPYAGSYSQSFDNLLPTPVPASKLSLPQASVLPQGWTAVESLANADSSMQVDDGSSGTGDTMLFGANGSNERALGSYSSGSLTSVYGVALVNNTGTTLTDFTLAFTGEQWKNGISGTAVLNKLTFDYSTSATTLSATAGFTAVPALDFTAPQGGTSGSDTTLNGNQLANQQSVSGTVSGISWAPGATLFLRWTDINDAGNDDGLAIDNLTISSVVDHTPSDMSLSPNTVAENAGDDALVGLLSTSDADPGDSFTYSLVSGTGGDDNGSFEIDGSTLKARNNLDYELDKHSYSVRVQTDDGRGGTFEKALTINLTNVNEAPSLTSVDLSFFAENGTATAYTVAASDPDGDTLTYALSGADAGLFNIDSGTGAITFKSAPDFEVPADADHDNVYSLTVGASDGLLSDTKNVTITVTDVYEPTAPTVAVTSGDVEYSRVAYVASATVTGATGVDSGAAVTFEYYVGTGTSGANLGSVAPSNVGTYTVVAHFAGDATYTAGQGTKTFQIVPKVLSASATAVGKEYDGTDVAAVSVSLSGVISGDAVTASGTGVFAGGKDAGTGKTVSVSGITLSGPDAGNYTVNGGATTTADVTRKALTGSVTAGDKEFDGTTSATITGRTLSGVISGDTVGYVGGTATFDTSAAGAGKTVTATGLSLDGPDAGNYTVNGTATTTASITTPSNVAPVVAAQSFTVNAKLLVGSQVGKVVASDADAGQTLSYAFVVVGGAAVQTSGSFAIDAGTGVITRVGTAALAASTTLTVRVTDSYSPSPASSQAAVTVVANTTAGARPVVAGTASFTLAENNKANAAVGTIAPTLAYSGQTFTYTLSGADAASFAVAAGKVTVKAATNFEAKSSYSFNVVVADSKDATKTTTVAVTVAVTNVNEAPVLSAGQVLSVGENSSVGTVVGTVVASDPDASGTALGTVKFGILVGTATVLTSGPFTINPDTGVVTLVGAVDKEKVAQYKLTVTATDQGTPGLVAKNTVIVNVTEANDAPTLAFKASATSATPNVGQAVLDTKTVKPFGALTIGDTDGTKSVPPTLDTLTVVVTLDDASKGAFTTPSLTASGFVAGTGTGTGGNGLAVGSYRFTGTAPAATTAIKALVFAPTLNRVAVGLAETTRFTVSANDGHVTTTDSTTTVVSTSVNDNPTVTGTNKLAPPQTLTDKTTLAPFTLVSIVDPDVVNTTGTSGGTGQTLAVVVKLDVAAKGSFSAASLTASGFVATETGSYSFTGTAAAATAAVRKLVFVPTANRVKAGLSESTKFTITVNDLISGSKVASDANTVVSTTSVNDAPTGLSFTAGTGVTLTGGGSTINVASSTTSPHVVKAGVTLGTFKGVDADLTDTFTYAFVSGSNDNVKFVLELGKGTLKVGPAALTPGDYTVQLTVSDLAGASLATPVSYTVHVS